MLHSFAGAAIRGGADTLVTGRTLLTRELYADQTGILLCRLSFWCTDASLMVSCSQDKLRASSQAYSLKPNVIGVSSSVYRANVGNFGQGNLDGGSSHSSKVDIDAGRSEMDLRFPVSSAPKLRNKENNIATNVLKHRIRRVGE